MNSSPEPTPRPVSPEIAALAAELTPPPRTIARRQVFGAVVNTLAILLLVLAIFTIEHQRNVAHKTQTEFNARQVKVNAQVKANEVETERLARLATQLSAKQDEVNRDVNTSLCTLINSLVDPATTQNPGEVRFRAALNCPRPAKGSVKPTPSPTP